MSLWREIQQEQHSSTLQSRWICLCPHHYIMIHTCTKFDLNPFSCSQISHFYLRWPLTSWPHNLISVCTHHYTHLYQVWLRSLQPFLSYQGNENLSRKLIFWCRHLISSSLHNTVYLYHCQNPINGSQVSAVTSFFLNMTSDLWPQNLISSSLHHICTKFGWDPFSRS